MDVNFKTLEVCLVAAGVVAIPAAATSLFSVDIQRTTLYNQTSSVAPTSPANVAVFFEVDPPGDFTSGSVDSPLASGVAQLNPGFDGGGSPDLQSMEFDFSSEADALAKFPDGSSSNSTYTFNLVDSNNTSENTSVQMKDISTGATLGTPAATGTTWNGLQGLDATTDFTFSYNADTNSNALDFLEIVQCSDPTCANFVSLAYFNSASPGNTSFDLPANTFLPGTPYLAALFFTAATGVPNTGTLTELSNETNMTFETMTSIPEPGTWLSLLTGLAGLAIWRWRRAMQDCRLKATD